MFWKNDVVRIRASHVAFVKGYQIKSLGYRRLRGKVTAINGTACRVDFTQTDHPILSSGKRPGENVRINRHSPYFRLDGYFSFEMLEAA